MINSCCADCKRRHRHASRAVSTRLVCFGWRPRRACSARIASSPPPRRRHRRLRRPLRTISAARMLRPAVPPRADPVSAAPAEATQSVVRRAVTRPSSIDWSASICCWTHRPRRMARPCCRRTDNCLYHTNAQPIGSVRAPILATRGPCLAIGRTFRPDSLY